MIFWMILLDDLLDDLIFDDLIDDRINLYMFRLGLMGSNH